MEDIEESLNIITYIRRDQENYHDVKFDILQKDNCLFAIMIGEKQIINEFDSYSQAYAYAMGYIDSFTFGEPQCKH